MEFIRTNIVDPITAGYWDPILSYDYKVYLGCISDELCKDIEQKKEELQHDILFDLTPIIQKYNIFLKSYEQHVNRLIDIYNSIFQMVTNSNPNKYSREISEWMKSLNMPDIQTLNDLHYKEILLPEDNLKFPINKEIALQLSDIMQTILNDIKRRTDDLQKLKEFSTRPKDVNEIYEEIFKK